MAFWNKRGKMDEVEVYQDDRYPNDVFIANASSDRARDIVACTGEWDADGDPYIPPYINGSDRITLRKRGHKA